MKISYPCKIESDDGGRYVVQFVDFDEAFTEGESEEEALHNAAEVLSLVIEQRLADKEGLPVPSTENYEYFVEPDASAQSAALIHLSRGEHSIADLARSLKTSWASVQRLENPKHSPTLRQVERAANAMGKKLVLNFE